MKLKTVRAPLGAMWVRAGFRVFFRQPLAFGVLFALSGLAMLLLTQVPLLGNVLALGLMPVATLAFMLTSRAALDGHTPTPQALLAPWRDGLQRRRLVMVGLAYALTALLALAAVQASDGGRFDAALQALAEGRATPETLEAAGLGRGLLLRLGVFGVLSMVFWHAPALVHWGRMGAAKAVFASVVACVRSLGAFSVYGLTWFSLTAVFAMVAQVLFALLGSPQGASLVLVLGATLFSTVFYASLYFTFADSFELDEADAPTALA